MYIRKAFSQVAFLRHMMLLNVPTLNLRLEFEPIFFVGNLMPNCLQKKWMATSLSKKEEGKCV